MKDLKNGYRHIGAKDGQLIRLGNAREAIISDEFMPYFKLWAHVIKAAISDEDVKFFKGERFVNICDLMGIDENTVICALPKTLKDKVLKK